MRFNFRLFVPVTVGYQRFGGGGNSDSEQSNAETIEDWPGDTRSRRLGSPRYKRHAKRLASSLLWPFVPLNLTSQRHAFYSATFFPCIMNTKGRQTNACMRCYSAKYCESTFPLLIYPILWLFRLNQNQKEPDERKRERDRLREKKRIAETWGKGTTSPKEATKNKLEIVSKNNEEKVEEEVGAGGRESPQATKADEGQNETRQAEIDRVAQVSDEVKNGEGSGENKAKGNEEGKEGELNVTSSEVRHSSKEELFIQLMTILGEELSATRMFDETGQSSRLIHLQHFTLIHYNILH